MNIVKIKAKRAFKYFFNNTKKKSIRLVPGKVHMKDDDESRMMTKIGGKPYWPETSWPCIEIGKETINLLCAAQINLVDMPDLPGYPKEGLLQFFILPLEDMDIFNRAWARCITRCELPTNCLVIYRNKCYDRSIEEYPRTTLDEKTLNSQPGLYSIRGVYYPTAKIEDQSMTSSDRNYNEEMLKAINKEFHSKYTITTLPKEIEEAFENERKKKDSEGCRLGGHPYFTQFDARDDHYSELLLQLDSEAGMMWGDAGVANFFIDKDDLERNDFTDVYFHWDHC